jgi:hypothetical protein
MDAHCLGHAQTKKNTVLVHVYYTQSNKYMYLHACTVDVEIVSESFELKSWADLSDKS